MESSITVKEITAKIWSDIECFFTTGGDSGCWCVNHRLKPQDEITGEPAKKMLQESIAAKKARGLLAYLDNQPIGWCAIDRTCDLLGHDCIKGPQEENIWAIHCLCVRACEQKQKIENLMVQRALKLVKEYGAKIVEVYPEPNSEPGKFITWNTFSGSVALFQQFGFQQFRPIDQFYTVMRKNIDE